MLKLSKGEYYDKSEKSTIFILLFSMLFTIIIPCYAKKEELLDNSIGIEIFEKENTYEINYTEQREDGQYYISEVVKGNNIDSKIYKVENNQRILTSNIVSKINKEKISCTEYSKGKISSYDIDIERINFNNKENKKNDTYETLGGKKYLRSENYGISLVGKKVTIAMAAAAIVAVTAYVSLPVAIDIIKKSINSYRSRCCSLT